MNTAKRLVGITSGGTFVKGKEALLKNNFLAVVATNRAALGKKLNRFCTPGSGLPWELGDDLIHVVVGDPYLLKDVKVVAYGELKDLGMPDDVREVFLGSVGSWTWLVVFENKNGSRVYVRPHYAATLDEARHLIDKKFLRGV